MSITKTLEQLRALQQIDLRIQVIGRELTQLPQELGAVKEDLAAVQAKYDAAKAEHDAVLKARREIEAEVAACDTAVIKYENEKLKVKTNDEFRAINNQIDHQRNKKSDLEDKVLESFETEEVAVGKVKKLKAEVDLVAARVTTKEKELTERSGADKAEIGNLNHSRAEILPTIEAPMLRRYERLRETKGGLAVATLIRGACGGCFTTLPAQVVAEVRRMDKVLECEHCARILVWDQVEANA